MGHMSRELSVTHEYRKGSMDIRKEELSMTHVQRRSSCEHEQRSSSV